MTDIDWKARACTVRLPTEALIGDKAGRSAQGATFTTYNPATGQPLADIAHCLEAVVNRAVGIARETFERGTWSPMAPRERKKALFAFAKLIEKDAETLALLETLDVGKPIYNSLNLDVPNTIECVTWFAEVVDKLYGQVAPTGPDVVGTITREPKGVVAAIVPWNVLMVMAAWKFATVLAAGNSIILKPAEQSPLTAFRLGELALEAGLPPGVFQVLLGCGETTGCALGLHMDVDALAFTGSTKVGRYIMQYAAKSNLKALSFEMGGKSPNTIFADCPDLDRAAEVATDGIFYNQGEACSAGSRLLVERSILPEITECLLKYTQTYAPGDPLDVDTRMGALIDTPQTERVLSYINAGRRDGAKLIAGGGRVLEQSGGNFVAPTIFGEVNMGMTIAKEEIFGPVLATIPFDSQAEAVQIANDSVYGLMSGVWTSDVTRAHEMIRDLRTGTVCVNCYNEGDITVPFSGFRQSSFGTADRAQSAISKYQDTNTAWIRLSTTRLDHLTYGGITNSCGAPEGDASADN